MKKNQPTRLRQKSSEVGTPSEEAYRDGKRRRRMKHGALALLLLLESALLVTFAVLLQSLDRSHAAQTQVPALREPTTVMTEPETVEAQLPEPDGESPFYFQTGAVYIGSWENGVMSGHGTLKIPSEGTYEGEFSNSKKTGHGVFTWLDGATYNGAWLQDQMYGQGIFTCVDGTIYKGSFQNNQFQTGTCTFQNETGSYMLRYRDGQIDRVSIVFPDGTVYHGDTDGSTLSGTGTMTFADGDRYKGSYLDGKRAGQGTYTWSSGASYKGAWEDDQMTGYGVYTYADGQRAEGRFSGNRFIKGSYTAATASGTYVFSVKEGKAVSVTMTLTDGTKYTGEMKDEKLTGSAQIVYANGDTYSGQVENGSKSGSGSYHWNSGASYEGAWAQDTMNGTGTYFYPDGSSGYKLVGQFKNGLPTGRCTYFVSKTESYQTDWVNGGCVKIYE